MKVFLSSTYLDLIEHRKAVVQALRTMGQDVDHMEIFGARDEEPAKASLEELDLCDVLVGIYAYRYGTVPKGSKTSVTEQEYLHAISKKMPILVFVINEDHDWPPKKMDKSLSKINKFKSKAKNEHTPTYFTTPDNLSSLVVASIGKLEKKKELRPTSDSRIPTPEPRKLTGSTLPNQPYFFGRDKELAIIADAISPDSRTWGALIDGPGGIGKTALAIRAARLAPNTLFERKIFVTAKLRELTPEGEKPLKDFSRNNYFSMLNELALELGEEGIPRLAPDERTNMLRMAMTRKKTLIVFDNLETLVENERTRLFQFLSRLPEGNKAIVTSRRRADVDARIIRLDRLSSDEALQLMEELAKTNKRLERESKEERYKLYEITNGNPLLIKWVCGQLGRESSAMHTIAEAYKFIQNAPKGNDPLEYIFGDLAKTFNENETKALAALTHFESPAHLSWITIMTQYAAPVIETALEDLSDRSIINAYHEEQWFYLPPLAAQFIRKKQFEIVEKVGQDLAIQIYWLLRRYGNESIKGNKIIEEYWPLIVAAFPYIRNSKNSHFQMVADNLYSFLEFTGRYDDCLWLSEEAEQAATEAKDFHHAGWRTYESGFIYSLRGQAREVLDCVERIEKYWLNADPLKRSIAISLKGLGYYLDKKYSEAIEAFRDSLSIDLDKFPDSNNVSATLNYLANAEFEIGNLESAERTYREALRIAEKFNKKESIAIYTGNLARLMLARQDFIEAESLGRKALKLSKKVNRIYLTAFISMQLAKSLSLQGKSRSSLPYAHRAVQIFTQLRHKDLLEAEQILAECRAAIHIENKKPKTKKN